jgi:ABC-type polysaccharide/polyol phosphate transport system ATPase subunit
VSASPAVIVDRVSKRFILAHQGGSLKARALDALRPGALRSDERVTRETFWALREVSLSIPRGSTFGLIGPNGCGKSTLLQTVAGILEPDEGSVTLSGRVTSLLELGAGFSPDLTGRENIFLNASLYGVPRETIAARFDEIVAFAELERFIDMPVRTYSSGMHVRLGFSVAVHLDPEILLVDEALAVGDERFQRKCLRVIKDFQSRGLTIVIVSHDLILVEQLCTQAALLQQGRLVACGAPAEVIGEYHATTSERDVPGGGHRWGTGAAEVTRLELLTDDAGSGADSVSSANASGKTTTATVRTRDALTIRMHYRCREAIARPVFGLAVHRDDGVHVSGPNTQSSGLEIAQIEGEGAIDYRIESLPLLPGRYYLSAAIYDHDLITPFDHRDRFVTLVVIEGGTRERLGLIELPARWSVTASRYNLA